MSIDEPTSTPANRHRVDIGNNMALVGLYVAGIGALVLGLVTLGISSALVGSASDPSNALVWQTLGALTTNAGGLLFTGALVAHAVNWQIGRSSGRA